MKSTGNWKLGFLLALTTALMWGLLPIAMKVLLKSMDPFSLTWFRFVVALVMITAYLAYKKKIPSIKKFSRRNIILLAVASVALAGNYVLYLKGLVHVSPNTAQVVIQLAPVLLFLGGIVIFKESIRGLQWLGVVILFGGLMLFFRDRLSMMASEWRGDFYKGVIFIILAAVCWMTYALAQKAALRDYSSDQILAVIYLSASILVLPISDPSSVMSLNLVQIGFLAFACLNTFIAYGCFAEALNLWDVSRVSAVIATAPIFTIIFMKMILSGDYLDMGANPDITLIQGFSAVAVVIGSVIVALGNRGKIEDVEKAKLTLPD
ncbi:MAG: DMT family transporter [Acidobacteriota bacterium]